MVEPGIPEHRAGGFVWCDIERGEPDWQEQLQAVLGCSVDDRHIGDCVNSTHPPYYEGTDHYDLLVARTLDPESPVEAPRTRPVAFIVTAQALVSIRPPGDPVFTNMPARWAASVRRTPVDSGALLYQLLDEMVDALLLRREPVSELLSQWQERLLDDRDPFQDWLRMMRLRAQFGRLEVTAQDQVDAIEAWREQTPLALDAALTIHINDVQEHLRRVHQHAQVVRQDIDSLVQIYFSANGERNNATLRVLTVVSAVFLPLNLLVGLFGTNFDHLPLLHARYGPWWLLGLMLVVSAALLAGFRARRWL
jgi:Mg2+ and Co2+ transporter CorA